jgi:hypothetical protein
MEPDEVKQKRNAGPVKRPVSERAVLARINRVLAKRKAGRVYKARRDDAPTDYFRVLKGENMVQYVELQDLAEELGVIRSWEVLSK